MNESTVNLIDRCKELDAQREAVNGLVEQLSENTEALRQVIDTVIRSRVPFDIKVRCDSLGIWTVVPLPFRRKSADLLSSVVRELGFTVVGDDFYVMFVVEPPAEIK